jgi:hypothetical protein
LKIGYAVVAADIDGDKKSDVVVVDQHKVVWYRNPGKQGAEWTKFVILDGKTKPDNVCVAPIDIDGDGLPELVVGAAWKPFDTANPGQLVWLKRGADVTKSGPCTSCRATSRRFTASAASTSMATVDSRSFTFR